MQAFKSVLFSSPCSHPTLSKPLLALITIRPSSQQPSMQQGRPDEPEKAPDQAAYRDDMSESYGEAYSIRSSDEGFGERYGEQAEGAARKLKEKEAKREAARKGGSGGRNVGHEEEMEEKRGSHDKPQESPVSQKERTQHSTGSYHGGLHVNNKAKDD